jgi:HAD superfamily hydrolase (TIGR01509 family)
MVSVVLLDFGGTLDGEGLHWLDRFYAIWAACVPGQVERAAIKAAFYEADRCLEADPTIGACRYDDMMRRHAAHQLRFLGMADDTLADRLAAAFAGPAAAALGRSRDVLCRLKAQGYRLGVVSNFYGNVEALCDEAGLSPLLDVILDSAVVGLRKPDPRFFQEALARMGVAAQAGVMVGDSFDRDVRPARALGMRTLWLAPAHAAACPDPALVDGVLESLAELPDRLADWRRA